MGKWAAFQAHFSKIKKKIHEDKAHHMKNYILTISYSMFMDVRMYMRYVEANNWFCKMVTDCGTPINGQSIKNQIKQWAHCGLQLQKKQLNGQNQFYMTRKYYHIVYELCVDVYMFGCGIVMFINGLVSIA